MESSPNENTTEPNLRTILEAVDGLRSEMKEQVEGLRSEMKEQYTELKSELRDLNVRVTAIETDMREVKEMQFVFENEFDRLIALSHNSLQLSHDSRADVRIMRREIEA